MTSSRSYWRDALDCRYEGHLGRELDRSLARYARLQEARRLKEQAIMGEVVEPVRLVP